MTKLYSANPPRFFSCFSIMSESSLSVSPQPCEVPSDQQDQTLFFHPGSAVEKLFERLSFFFALELSRGHRAARGLDVPEGRQREEGPGPRQAQRRGPEADVPCDRWHGQEPASDRRPADDGRRVHDRDGVRVAVRRQRRARLRAGAASRPIRAEA